MFVAIIPTATVTGVWLQPRSRSSSSPSSACSLRVPLPRRRRLVRAEVRVLVEPLLGSRNRRRRRRRRADRRRTTRVAVAEGGVGTRPGGAARSSPTNERTPDVWCCRRCSGGPCKVAVVAVLLAAYGVPVGFHTLFSVLGGNALANIASLTPGGRRQSRPSMPRRSTLRRAPRPQAPTRSGSSS